MLQLVLSHSAPRDQNGGPGATAGLDGTLSARRENLSPWYGGHIERLLKEYRQYHRDDGTTASGNTARIPSAAPGWMG